MRLGGCVSEQMLDKDYLSKMSNSTSIHNSLSELGGVFADVGESRGGDALQAQFWLLDAEDKEGNSSSIDNSL